MGWVTTAPERCDRDFSGWPHRRSPDDRPRGEILIAGCTRRNWRPEFLGRGFDSHRLHHKLQPAFLAGFGLLGRWSNRSTTHLRVHTGRLAPRSARVHTAQLSRSVDPHRLHQQFSANRQVDSWGIVVWVADSQKYPKGSGKRENGKRCQAPLCRLDHDCEGWHLSG